MDIRYFSVDPSGAQVEAIYSLLRKATIRPALVSPDVIMTISNRIGNSVKITIAQDGTIADATFVEYEG